MANTDTNTRNTTRLLWKARGRYARVLGTVREVQQALWRHRDLINSNDETTRAPLHADIAEALVSLFRENGGAWIKFAQFLSCRPDLLPPAYIDAFANLREQAPQAHFDDLQPWLEELLGRNWTQQFRAFNIIPVATASIAQVHKACLIGGEEVAVKLQLPRVQEEFSQDAAAMRALARLLAPLLRELDLRQVVEQLIRTTERELDFQLEARHMIEFAALPHIQGIRIPKVFPEFGSGRLLVTEWMPGPSLSQLLDEDPERAKPVLERLMNSAMQQVLQFGFFHADPHPGNFIVTPDGDLAVLDMGAVQQLEDSERMHYTALLLRLLGQGSEPLQPLFEAAGFGGIDEGRLNRLSEALISARDDPDATLADNLQALLEEFRRQRLLIPDPFVAMIRVLITIGGLVSKYGIPFRLPVEIAPA